MTGQPGGDPHAGWTPVVVQGPLPMDVAGTLMKLIGAAWPSSVIDGSGRHPRGTWDKYALVMLIDPKDRAKRVTKKQVAELKDHDDGGGDFLRFSTEEDRAVLLTAPPQDLMALLGDVAHTIIDAHEDAANYLEWSVRTRDGAHAYVLSIARSKGQTPHQMRVRAETELKETRAQIETLRGLLSQASAYMEDAATPPDLWPLIDAALGESEE